MRLVDSGRARAVIAVVAGLVVLALVAACGGEEATSTPIATAAPTVAPTPTATLTPGGTAAPDIAPTPTATAAPTVTPTPAPTPIPFYKGKTIKLIVRSSPGGGYDFYGRLVARHISKYIPGKPRINVINIPGAGGIVATNYMAVRAASDGTELAILPRELAITERLGQSGLDYDTAALIPIGSAAAETRVWTVDNDLPIEGPEDLKGFPGTVKFSATGPGSGGFQMVKLLEFEGFPVKAITGYSGTPEKLLAVLRGDVEGTSGSYESLLTPINEGEIKVIARLGAAPEGTDFPDIRDFLSPAGRALADLMTAPLVAGRPFFTAPDTPANLVEILRQAFKDVLEDPELLSEAERANRTIFWTSPEEMQRTYEGILSAPDEVVGLFQELVQ